MKVLYTNQFVFSKEDCWNQNWTKISFLSKNITKIIFTVPKQGFVRFFVKYNKGTEEIFIFYVSCNFPLNSTSLDTNIV
jgi:hypothetical protein